jgi:hypothetical protein
MRDALDVVAAGGLLLAMGGCSVFTAVKPSAASSAVDAVSSSVVPASVAWPLAVGSILLMAAAVFTWVVLGNRRRALLMIAAAIACAVLPPILLDFAGKLVWPLVVITALAGLAGLAYVARWSWEAWRS